jgi:hypothetical protein
MSNKERLKALAIKYERAAANAEWEDEEMDDACCDVCGTKLVSLDGCPDCLLLVASVLRSCVEESGDVGDEDEPPPIGDQDRAAVEPSFG